MPRVGIGDSDPSTGNIHRVALIGRGKNAVRWTACARDGQTKLTGACAGRWVLPCGSTRRQGCGAQAAVVDPRSCQIAVHQVTNRIDRRRRITSSAEIIGGLACPKRAPSRVALLSSCFRLKAPPKSKIPTTNTIKSGSETANSAIDDASDPASRAQTDRLRLGPIKLVLPLHLHIGFQEKLLLVQRCERKRHLIGIFEADGHTAHWRIHVGGRELHLSTHANVPT